MAPEWAMQFGMDQSAGFGAAGAAAVPAYMYGMPAAETLRVDDLLDFTNHDLLPSSSSSSSSVAADTNLLVTQNQLSPAADFGRAFGFGGDSAKASFPEDIYIPSEEVAELEWLSKFVEDSFSDVPLQSLPYTETIGQSGVNIHRADVFSATGRGVRSKRSRGVAVAGQSGGGVQHHPGASAWPSSSSLTLSPTTTSSSSSSDFPIPNGGSRKKQGGMEMELNGGEVRRCTHCASEKTPQWRTGPLGPKTLCNACGVRYKSGRLVPEYRPASSPTFVLTQHSNSHRKVMELRRQKELLILHNNEDASSVAASSSRFSSAVARPHLLFHDYEVC